MFSLKNKLEKNLAISLKNNSCQKYRVIIHYRALPDKTIRKITSYNGTVLLHLSLIKCISAIISPKIIERLCELPQIDYITYDKFALLCGSSVLTSNSVNFRSDIPLKGKGVGIGIIDSGVYPHPDLMNPSRRIKSFLDLINDLKYPYDDNGHGTFTSGIIASSGRSSKGLYRGIAPDANLHCIKAFNDIGKGHISTILYGIEHLVINQEEYNLKVICLPFEIIDNDYFILKLFTSLFNMCVNKGMVVVVPTGHNGDEEGSLKGIATLDNCITVAGINTLKAPRGFKHSSVGSSNNKGKPDLSAACVNVCSLNSNTNYISERNGRKLFPSQLDQLYINYTGTSVAAAYVAGVTALIFESNPDLRFGDIKSLLTLSCEMHKISKYVQGNGLLNLNKLIEGVVKI